MKYQLKVIEAAQDNGFVARAIFDNDGNSVNPFADLRRIVACLNYCEEITTQQLERACDAQSNALET